MFVCSILYNHLVHLAFSSSIHVTLSLEKIDHFEAPLNINEHQNNGYRKEARYQLVCEDAVWL